MSLRLRLVAALARRIVKPGLHRLQDPGRARARFERTARLAFRIAPGTACLPDSFSAPGGPRPALWSVAPGMARRAVLLYLHGGGYVAGSPDTHRAVTCALARRARLRVLAPDYRLAPEHPYPAALDDAAAAHRTLLDRGHRPGDIVIGGDSAGGGLALALTARLCAQGTPPAGLFAWSPWTDLTLGGESLLRNSASESLLPVSRIVQMRDLYAAGADPRDPGLSPLFARFPAPPPALIQLSESEILADDGFRMADRLRAAGADLRLESWPDAPHVWHLLAGWLPEADAALAGTARFVRRALGLPPVADES